MNQKVEPTPGELLYERSDTAPNISFTDLMQCRACRGEQEPIPLAITIDGGFALYAVRRTAGGEEVPAIPTDEEIQSIVDHLSKYLAEQQRREKGGEAP